LGRARIVVVGLFCNSAGSLLLAVGGEFQILLAGRVLQGISVAAISAPAMAALVELAPEQQPGLAARVATLALPVGATIGVLASAIGAEWTPWPQAFGVTVPVVLSAMLFPFLLFGANRDAAAAAPARQAPADPSRWHDLPAAFWVSCAIAFYASAIQVTVFAMGGPRLAEVLPSHPYLGAAVGMAVFLLVSVLGQTIWGHSALQGRAVGPIVLIALSEWVLQRSVADAALWVSGVTIAVCGFAYGALLITAQRAVNAAAPAQHRGLATSIFMSIRYVGAAIPVFGIGLYARDHGMADALACFALLTLAVGASLLAVIGVVHLKNVNSAVGLDFAHEPTDTSTLRVTSELIAPR